MNNLSLNLDGKSKKYFYTKANKIARVIVHIEKTMRRLIQKCDSLRSDANWSFDPDNIVYKKYNATWAKWTYYSTVKTSLRHYKTLFTGCRIELVNGKIKKLYSKRILENGKTMTYFFIISNKCHYTINLNPTLQKSIKTRYTLLDLIVSANAHSIQTIGINP